MKIKTPVDKFRFAGVLALSLGLGAHGQLSAQQETVEWVTLGGDHAHTRYTPATQINADNFTQLQTAWVWDGASFNASSGRSTPSYVDGKLFTVAGDRRHVIAIDPETGETIWSYREPHTFRHEYSMRKDYGKGVAYGEVDGRGVIYIISPAFFLTALDAETGAPLKGFGGPVGLEGFPATLPSRGTTRPVLKTSPATFWHLIPKPVNSSGSSMSSPRLASSASKPGRACPIRAS